jgi:hypothetical protein
MLLSENKHDRLRADYIPFSRLKEITMSDSIHYHAHCCPPIPETPPTEAQLEVSRRSFVAMGGAVMGGLTWSALQSELVAQTRLRGRTAATPTQGGQAEPIAMPTPRKPLIVKPVLVWDHPQRRDKTSWRNWGEVQTPEAATEEVARIKTELAALKQRVDFPIEFMEITSVNAVEQLKDNPDMAACDTILFYGAGHSIHGIQNFKKDVIFFQRWRSGPVYLQYEIIIPRFLRNHTDRPAIPGMDFSDVVTDDVTELDWRFRALCGLKNTRNSKIVAIGNPGAWAQPEGNVPEIAKKTWGFEYHSVSFDEIAKLIREAKADAKAMERAKKRAEAYLKIPGTKLETTNEFFVQGFLLEDVFRTLMREVGTNLITVNSCMGAIMPASETTACLSLSTLNDDGYLAFCESDFVVIPSGILLGNIAGKPVFLCNPNYPHKGRITVAHCSAPRKMDGKTNYPTVVTTHMESDYGSAPHIKYPIGTKTTHLIPAFNGKRWLDFKGRFATPLSV